MVSLSGWRQGIAAAAIMLTVAVSAVDPQLISMLPRHSAIAAGADFSALCTHPQSAAFFSELQKYIAGYGVELREAVYSCDAVTRRSSSFFRLGSAGDAEKVCRLAEKKAEATEYSDGTTVFCLNGKPGDRSLLRLAGLADGIAGLFSGYPRKTPFSIDRRGPAKEFVRRIPVRNVLFWAVGFPEFRGEPLNSLHYFEMAMENDLQSDLIIHGKAVFRNTSDAALAESFMPLALSMLLKRYFNIPPGHTLAAVQSLELVRQNEVLTFSAENAGAILNIVSMIVADQMKFSVPEAK